MDVAAMTTAWRSTSVESTEVAPVIFVASDLMAVEIAKTVTTDVAATTTVATGIEAVARVPMYTVDVAAKSTARRSTSMEMVEVTIADAVVVD